MVAGALFASADGLLAEWVDDLLPDLTLPDPTLDGLTLDGPATHPVAHRSEWLAPG